MTRTKSHKTKRVLAAACIVAALAVFGAQSSRADECRVFAPWLEALKKTDSARTLQETADFWSAERVTRVRVAERIFDGYFSGSDDVSRMESCLSQNPRRGDFFNTLQSVFYRKSLDRLRASRSPAIRWLIARLDERSAGGAIPLFRLTGHFHQDNPGQYEAGFHRATGSIYMDLPRIRPEEWQIIFVHEILHGLDPLLSESIRAYSDQQDFIQHLITLSSTVNSTSALSADDRAQLSTWLKAGLGRGLWAEYRAWYPTLVIYQQGLQEGLWPKIDWVERILAEQSAIQSLSDFIYLYLDQRSEDPTDGIFSNALISGALREVRTSARNHPSEIPLGLLGQIPN